MVPAHLPRWLLLRVLAYRLQAAALGDLDKASLRVIRASQGGAIDFAARPFNNRKPTTRDGIGLNSGALLVREWRGKLERVMMLDKGFAWNGKTLAAFPKSLRRSPARVGTVTAFSACDQRRTRVRKQV